MARSNDSAPVSDDDPARPEVDSVLAAIMFAESENGGDIRPGGRAPTEEDKRRLGIGRSALNDVPPERRWRGGAGS